MLFPRIRLDSFFTLWLNRSLNERFTDEGVFDPFVAGEAGVESDGLPFGESKQKQGNAYE